MCVVSMVGDSFSKRWPEQYPWATGTADTFQYYTTGVSRDEFNELKKEVQIMKELLIKAKIYDEEHGEPDCEIDEKVELLRRVAELVGVDLEDVLGREDD
jgi:hypothetical protein